MYAILSRERAITMEHLEVNQSEYNMENVCYVYDTRYIYIYRYFTLD